MWHHNTGKTRTILELINQLCHHFPGLSVLIVRKYAVTLSTTCLKTFNEQVLRPGDGVYYYGGSGDEPASYRYPNGSRITVGGLDNSKASDKLLSAEYDLVYANEITELTEDNLVALKATLRHAKPDGTPIIEHRRVIGDCNPAQRGNWVNMRCESGSMRRIRTTLRDNPRFANPDGTWTAEGQRYLDENLPAPGTRRYDSWVLGLWGETENAIYPNFVRGVHVVPLPRDIVWRDGTIGADQGRIHSAGAVAVRVDQQGRRWVMEAWGQPDPEEGEMTARQIGRMSLEYGITRVRTDPTGAKVALAAAKLIKNAAVNAADGSPGARLARIRLTARLLQVWPGGYVPTIRQETSQRVPVGQWDDSPGLLFVEGGPGIDRLIDQIEGYHYVTLESVQREAQVVARINDDLVAAMEYAIEDLEAAPIDMEPRPVTIDYRPAANAPSYAVQPVRNKARV